MPCRLSAFRICVPLCLVPVFIYRLLYDTVGSSNGNVLVEASFKVPGKDGPLDSVFNGLEELMVNHAALHERQRSGSDAFRALVYTCTRGMFCGGFADRLEGMIVAYYLAVVARRAFFIEYDKPERLDRYYIPAKLDWRLTGLSTTERRILNASSTYSIKRRLDSRSCSGLVDHVLTSNREKRAVRINTNQGKMCVSRLLRELKLEPRLAPAEAMARAYAWLFQESPFIRTVLQPLELKWTPENSVCVHIRRGGDLTSSRDKRLSGAALVVERIRHQNLSLFWTCAQMVYKTLTLRNSFIETKQFTWLVVSDNDDTLRKARRNLPNRDGVEGASVIDTRSLGPVFHIDKLGKYKNVKKELLAQAHLRVFADHLLLSRCKYLIASHSSFSLTAAAIASQHKVTAFAVDWQRNSKQGVPACKEINPLQAFILGSSTDCKMSLGVKFSRSQRSPLWVHFQKNGNKANFNHCKKDLAFHGDTSNLSAHLKIAHASFLLVATGDSDAYDRLGRSDRISDIHLLREMNIQKVKAPPMQAIVTRIRQHGLVEVVIFDEATIFERPVAEWPVVDALISFFSQGFPLQKAIEYAKLREPFIINDLEYQYALQDRRKVYKILEEHNIETPRYAVLNREGDNLVQLEQDTESIQFNGVKFTKPFVEKPVDAENHNIYIYFPPSSGGGCQCLFRKEANRSSVYKKENRYVRESGSFIYEDFLPTGATDVKVYTVGEQYAHAEARKSPSLDGRVERDSQGKERRYPVILSQAEKEIARKVVLAFKQRVCGFDLLRSQGKSYVCDVNGFSFVKTSTKYYDDCAHLLSYMVLQKLAPDLLRQLPMAISSAPALPLPRADPSNELRCIIGIIRHGDRTPKQKMKMQVMHPRFFDIFYRSGGDKKKEVKLKKPEELQAVLDIARDLLEILENGETSSEVEEKKHKLRQLRYVLEMYDHFSGINRKVQLKYFDGKKVTRISAVKTRMTGEPFLLLILKWGGEITPAGLVQALELGQSFRCIYPEDQETGEAAAVMPGFGLLRLHSTYRHDLKIYASDEGRVQMTAAAFAGGFLDLEGTELPPLLAHLVKSDHGSTTMLDTSAEAADELQRVKDGLHELLDMDKQLDEEDIDKLAPTRASSLINTLKTIGNPQAACCHLHELVSSMVCEIRALVESSERARSRKGELLYSGEKLDLMKRRWEKLQKSDRLEKRLEVQGPPSEKLKDFRLPSGKFDYSKIPDIFDCIKYDALHNSHLQLKGTKELYDCAKALAYLVIPQEYGITQDDKVQIGRLICRPLLNKISSDLHQMADITNRLNPEYSIGIRSPNRHVRTRLYFTSESHIHSMLNLIRYGGFKSEDDPEWKRSQEWLDSVEELSYMTQVVFKLYEDQTCDDPDQRFHIELHFSNGALGFNCSADSKGSDSFQRASVVRQHSRRDSKSFSSMKKLFPESPQVTEPQQFEDRLVTTDGMLSGVLSSSLKESNTAFDEKLGTKSGQSSDSDHLRASTLSESSADTSSSLQMSPRTSSTSPDSSPFAPLPSESGGQPLDVAWRVGSTTSLHNVDGAVPVLVRRRVSMPLQPTSGTASLSSSHIGLMTQSEIAREQLRSRSVGSMAEVSPVDHGWDAEVPQLPAVSSVRPLRPLHLSVSLKEIDDFIDRMKRPLSV